MIVPDQVQLVHQHEANLCFAGDCRSSKITPNLGQINHYREKVRFQAENISISDHTVWKFKDQLIKDVEKTLNATNFKP